MSDTIKIELDQGSYNGLHGILGGFTGAAGTIGASKLRELITEAVRDGLVGETLPPWITIEVPKPVIDKVYEGVKVKLAEPKITTNELEQLKAYVRLLRYLVDSLLILKRLISKYLPIRISILVRYLTKRNGISC